MARWFLFFVLHAAALASCGRSAESGSEAHSLESYNFIGTWVDDPAGCGGTDHFIGIHHDGSAIFYNQHGRWSLEAEGLFFDMEFRPADEIYEAADAWSESIPVRTIDANRFILNVGTEYETTFHRCPE